MPKTKKSSKSHSTTRRRARAKTGQRAVPRELHSSKASNFNQIWPYFFGVFISLAAGAIGSFFTMPFIETWYAGLNKPFFSPPNWVFGPVWTVLYVLMGLAFGRILSLSLRLGFNDQRRLALELFVLQLILNSLWSIVFFGLQSPLMAFLVILALWVVLYLTIQRFSTICKTAAALLWPYLLWISFATILNLAIVWLN